MLSRVGVASCARKLFCKDNNILMLLAFVMPKKPRFGAKNRLSEKIYRQPIGFIEQKWLTT
jgi:hypothetical protein